MREMLLEIWVSMSKNKLRTFLTGFSIAWGIFILVVLLGAGNGLKNGVESNFADMAVNSMQIQGGWTSQPYAGYAKNRRIRLENSDLTVLQGYENIDKVGAFAWYRGQTLTYGDQYISASMEGLTDLMIDMWGIKIKKGRFINNLDNSEQRKVMVIDENIERVLFKNTDPVGKQVLTANNAYTVVGVFKNDRQFGNEATAYIPLQTGQLIYSQGNPRINMSAFTIEGIKTVDESNLLGDRVRHNMGNRHSFAPDDNSAIWISNNFEDFHNISRVFGGINIFLWVIGLGTLMAGVVGVSNIMLVTVRERTFEFGLRKAIGARPRSIIMLILLESVIVTALFGYLGMVLGVATMEVVNHFVEVAAAAAAASPDASQFNMTMFKDPTLNLSIVVSATLVLVVSGLIAGYIPARRAARLKTIDALRFNK